MLRDNAPDGMGVQKYDIPLHDGSGGFEVKYQSKSEPGVVLTWRERGGPAVEQPTRRGFGSNLLKSGLARELGGAVALSFEPEGLVCTISFPMSPRVQPG